jgi:hypothetical protein
MLANADQDPIARLEALRKIEQLRKWLADNPVKDVRLRDASPPPIVDLTPNRGQAEVDDFNAWLREIRATT